MSNPTLIGLSMDDPIAAVRDPKFTTLIRDGWTVAAHIPAERAGKQEWILMMVPPSKQLPAVDKQTSLWKSPNVPLVILVILQIVQLTFNLIGA